MFGRKHGVVWRLIIRVCKGMSRWEMIIPINTIFIDIRNETQKDDNIWMHEMQKRRDLSRIEEFTVRKTLTDCSSLIIQVSRAVDEEVSGGFAFLSSSVVMAVKDLDWNVCSTTTSSLFSRKTVAWTRYSFLFLQWNKPNLKKFWWKPNSIYIIGQRNYYYTWKEMDPESGHCSAKKLRFYLF